MDFRRNARVGKTSKIALSGLGRTGPVHSNGGRVAVTTETDRSLQVASADSAEVLQGETRDIVAKFAGVSHGTLAKAEEIVKAAEEKPEKFRPLLEKVDSGEVSINYASQRMPSRSARASLICGRPLCS